MDNPFVSNVFQRFFAKRWLDLLIGSLLIVALVTDRYTIPGFAHGVLYTPILMLAMLRNNQRYLAIIFLPV